MLARFLFSDIPFDMIQTLLAKFGERNIVSPRFGEKDDMVFNAGGSYSFVENQDLLNFCQNWRKFSRPPFDEIPHHP